MEIQGTLWVQISGWSFGQFLGNLLTLEMRKAAIVLFLFPHCRVAELGSLSSEAKIAMKIFVKRVFTIFASNASFLRVIANLQN